MPEIGSRVSVRPMGVFGGSHPWHGIVVRTSGPNFLVIKDDDDGKEYTVPVHFVSRLS
ncbi:MAG: hypothetical protein H7X80_02360 [bacterium]|nr:hypothetical protein [Candidatus Kapabacteria bacterium]